MTAFVPCPACGGPVHPIASRCKHCKADLLKHKEEAARAARAQSQGGLRQTFKGQAPVAGAKPAERAASPAPQHTPAPQLVYAQPSPWSRRWPIAVSALAVVAIVASLIILLAGKDDDDEQRLPSRTGNSPRMVPDEMGTPDPHSSNVPRADPDPDDPFAPRPLDPGGPKPKAWTTAPDPGMFAVALTESVCAKFEDCGLRDALAADLCRELAKGMSTPDIDAKVQSGECRYDRGAASACLRAVDRLSCTMAATGGGDPDLSDLMGQAMSLMDCTTALVCH